MASLELEARLDNLLATAQEETKDIDLFAPIPAHAHKYLTIQRAF